VSRSYSKNNTGTVFFWDTVYWYICKNAHGFYSHYPPWLWQLPGIGAL